MAPQRRRALRSSRSASHGPSQSPRKAPVVTQGIVLDCPQIQRLYPSLVGAVVDLVAVDHVHCIVQPAPPCADTRQYRIPMKTFLAQSETFEVLTPLDASPSASPPQSPTATSPTTSHTDESAGSAPNDTVGNGTNNGKNGAVTKSSPTSDAVATLMEETAMQLTALATTPTRSLRTKRVTTSKVERYDPGQTGRVMTPTTKRRRSRSVCPVCVGPWDSEPMIQCDMCRQWIHGRCEDDIDDDDDIEEEYSDRAYSCPLCREATHAQAQDVFKSICILVASIQETRRQKRIQMRPPDRMAIENQ
ncbi:PHD-type domain-containing protein [Plasmodiophora brassicae]|uniref:PHD-type domain-containing protein n=1 Tax=Plasmodiophora brassicae TaxID=37360 RepID=A0A0G4J4U8_PLABS|nr:hypothetical protein PBRA_008993 [Plasmodiophora brassicae]SPQ95778.1 unnamed protein product [Plasmodiophora brassicae]